MGASFIIAPSLIWGNFSSGIFQRLEQVNPWDTDKEFSSFRSERIDYLGMMKSIAHGQIGGKAVAQIVQSYQGDDHKCIGDGEGMRISHSRNESSLIQSNKDRLKVICRAV